MKKKKNCEVFIFCNFTLFLSPCFRLMFRSTVLFFVCIQWNRMTSGSIYCCDFVDVGFVLRSYIVYTVRTLVLLRILRERVFVLYQSFDPDRLKYVLKTVCTRFKCGSEKRTDDKFLSNTKSYIRFLCCNEARKKFIRSVLIVYLDNSG